jgi:hypothetical protein
MVFEITISLIPHHPLLIHEQQQTSLVHSNKPSSSSSQRQRSKAITTKGSDRQIAWIVKWNPTQTTHYNRDVKNNYMSIRLVWPYEKNPIYQFLKILVTRIHILNKFGIFIMIQSGCWLTQGGSRDMCEINFVVSSITMYNMWCSLWHIITLKLQLDIKLWQIFLK